MSHIMWGSIVLWDAHDSPFQKLQYSNGDHYISYYVDNSDVCLPSSGVIDMSKAMVKLNNQIFWWRMHVDKMSFLT